MGAISLDKTNELFWLGRYAERVLTSLRLFNGYYDLMIDTDRASVAGICARLNIPDVYGTVEAFITDYLFDTDDPNSIVSNLGRAFDNAVLLRGEISSESLSYIQMSFDVMRQSAESTAPLLEVQQVVDYMLAFWGSCDDYVLDQNCRDIMKCGQALERVDLYLRLESDPGKAFGEFSRLLSRLYRAGISYDPGKLNRLVELFEGGAFVDCSGEALELLNSLFYGV